MPELRIVYTPEASYYRRGDIDMHAHMEPQDKKILKLRERYAALKEVVPDLPEKVGIVSYTEIFKRHSLRHSEQIDNPTTNYLPLDIMEQILALKDLDFKDSLVREYAKRTLMYLTENATLHQDRSLPVRLKLAALLSCAIPGFENVANGYKDVREYNKDNEVFKDLRPSVDAVITTLTEQYTSWQDLDDLYDLFVSRFNANRVSREFPLIYLSPGYLFPELHVVSLRDEIETSLRDTDHFAETEQLWCVEDISELLEKLPEPKTIITDVYIVDRFPELADMDFEAVEFNPFSVICL